jgi:hypothetical protein
MQKMGAEMDSWFFNQERRLGIERAVALDGNDYEVRRVLELSGREWQVLANSQVIGYLSLTDDERVFVISDSEHREVTPMPVGGPATEGMQYAVALITLGAYLTGYGRGHADQKASRR